MDRAVTSRADDEIEVLLAAADLVTLARTGVIYDYRGNVIDAHAPEMPTRLAKQLVQVVRGAVAVGMARSDAMRLALRVARDSMPPIRLAIINDLAAHPWSSTAEVRKRIGKPRATTDRQTQALHSLGVLDVLEEDIEWAGKPATRWYYSLAATLDPNVLSPESVPEMSVPTRQTNVREGRGGDAPQEGADLSGTDPGGAL